MAPEANFLARYCPVCGTTDKNWTQKVQIGTVVNLEELDSNQYVGFAFKGHYYLYTHKCKGNQDVNSLST